ncbi:MAG: lysophospholipid acyltransferase family protein [Desulfovibrionaceae bacterium]|nr:lysophospholipid acyltransferase family protein [Desulfovibrionaceae bacterium]
MKIPIDPAWFTPLFTVLYRLWIRSIRFTLVGSSEFIELNESGQPVIIALFHGELFPVTGFGSTLTSNLVTFVSQSKDGEIIARVLERLGHVTVRGSSSKGGVRALLRAKRIMERDRRMAVFTVDGPRGPRQKAKGGVLFLAQRAGARIVPFRAFPERAKVFDKSWDKFTLPMPFSRCTIRIGEPFDVTGERLDEAVLKREQERLEQYMLSLQPDA